MTLNDLRVVLLTTLHHTNMYIGTQDSSSYSSIYFHLPFAIAAFSQSFMDQVFENSNIPIFSLCTMWEGKLTKFISCLLKNTELPGLPILFF